MDKKRDIARTIDLLSRRHNIPNGILDPCCGNMRIAQRLRSLGYGVVATDYVRGYGQDFLSMYTMPVGTGNIVTIPPKKDTESYVMHALEILPQGGQCIMLIRTSFLEGQDRYKRIFRTNPPKKVLQFSERVDDTRTAYSWMIWVKGEKTTTTLEWI